MPIGHTKEYYVKCEMYDIEGRTMQDVYNCYGGGYESHLRSNVVDAALSAGWLRVGKKWYCPYCRRKMENREEL